MTGGTSGRAREEATGGMPEQGSGRCLCGAVRYVWREKPSWAGHCHCESCRRACSAPFTSFFGVRDGAWDWTGAPPHIYESSPGVRRAFCPRCGSQMTYAADAWPGETHFYAASMDNPALYAPTEHFFDAERLAWVHLNDGLHRHRGSQE